MPKAFNHTHYVHLKCIKKLICMHPKCTTTRVTCINIKIGFQMVFELFPSKCCYPCTHMSTWNKLRIRKNKMTNDFTEIQ